MAGLTLPFEHLRAGAEYRDTLKRLGLDPEGLLWAYDRSLNAFVLVLVTAHLDFAGPLQMYRLLTRAYNASVTPALIDPFIVRLHSPKQEIARALREGYGLDITIGPFVPDDPTIDPSSVSVETRITLDVGDLSFAHEWVYQLRDQKMPPAERSRHWRRFEKNVEALQIAA
ncbi:hypothetical protein MKK67_27265 [Methylobacterium sp. J-072]|uniref:hypothetical protein n=1 Tax=Methylobacterium sp. J-072 TaxID=2836651 RepID=UPI001FBA8E12|nr:hypothetical protein [Methylobacterium sp. J-072]MCJ2096170.1 hypothetical protein [Methylobacterium sp. J-072]